MNISIFIKEQRKLKNWTQAELASQLGVSQQAVSLWERGKESPKGREIDSLKTIFGEKFDGSQHAVIARPLVAILPIADLSWQMFEEFALDFLKLLYQDKEVRFNGKQGDKQDGLDILVEENGKTIWAFECKATKSFGPEKARRAMSRVPKSKKIEKGCVILLTRQATRGLQDEIKKNKDRNWSIWDNGAISREIYDKIAANHIDRAIRLVDRYFPGMAELFLGVRDKTNPWRIPEESFDTSIGFISHKGKLLGKSRENNLKQIIKDVTKSNKWLGLVSGRVGIGKTRLAKEIALKFSNLGYEVRVLEATTVNGLGIKADHFKLSPKSEKLLLIIDDAHQFGNIDYILRSVKEINSQAKVLLFFKDSYEQELVTNLQKLDLYQESFNQYKLKDISRNEAAELIRSAAGGSLSENTVRQLANVSYDCPFIGLFGAGLAAKNYLKDDDINLTRDIQSTVFNKFKAAYIDNHKEGPYYNNLRLSALRVIALLQPFDMNNSELIKEAIKVADLNSEEEFKRHVDRLIGTGVLLRRRSTLRIVPDLLGDFILKDACYAENLGGPTDYIDNFCKEIRTQHLKNALINASRVDSRIKQADPNSKSIIFPLWNKFEKEFKSGKEEHNDYYHLSLLDKLAYFQPQRTLDLISWFINKHFAKQQNTNENLDQEKISSVILDRIPPILKKIAYNLDFLVESVGLLWLLAKNMPKANQNDSDHPIKILQELCSYKTTKPLSFNLEMLNKCQSWLQDCSQGERIQIFSMIKELLAIMSEEGDLEGNVYTIKYIGLDPKTISGARQKAVEFILSEIESEDPQRSIAATNVLCESWSLANHLMSRNGNRPLKETWNSIFKGEIESLYKVINNSKQDPLVFVIINNYFYEKSVETEEESINKPAKKLTSLIPDSALYRFIWFLHDSWGIFPNIEHKGEDDYEKLKKISDKVMVECVSEILAEFKPPKLVEFLENRLELQKSQMIERSSPQEVIYKVVKQKTEIGVAICEYVKKSPESNLFLLLPTVLETMFFASDDNIFQITKELIKSDNHKLPLAAASSLRPIVANKNKMSAIEKELFIECAKHKNVDVRAQLVTTLGLLYESSPEDANNIFSFIEIVADLNLIKSVCHIFGPYYRPEWDHLSADCRENIWLALKKVESIRDSYITSFLQHVMNKEPLKVVQLFMDRVDWALELDGSPSKGSEYHVRGFDPVPHFDFDFKNNNLKVESYPGKENALKMIISWMAKNIEKNYRIHYMGRQIFCFAAGQYDQTVLRVIEEMLISGDDNQVRAVCSVLTKAPRDLVLKDVNSTTRLLHLAESLGGDYLKRISDSLTEALMTGVKMGSPSDEDIKQRDRSRLISESMSRGTPEYKFYDMLRRYAQKEIELSEAEEEKFRDGRDWR